MNRHLKNVFGSQENMDQFLKENLKADKNGNVSLDQLKHFLVAHCTQEMVQKKITKSDIEGFLSAFVYNAYGFTSAGAIAPLVFTDENYVAKRLNHRTRANPPPEDVNGDLYEVLQGDLQLSFKVKQVLQNLEEKVFAGPVKIYQVFRQFDKDGDGYVSYADFEDQLTALQVSASKHELAAVMKLLDKDGKGYLDFRAFAAGVHPHMSAQVPNPNSVELHLPNLVPSKAKAAEYGLKSSALQQAVNEARRTFQPDPEQSKTQ